MCIKQLSTTPAMSERLREMGLGEEQRIKLLARDSNFICQVCNARLGISQKLADSILVEAVAAAPSGKHDEGSTSAGVCGAAGLPTA